jgi:heptosyltransferase-2
MNEPLAPPLPCRVLVRGVNWLGDAVMTMPAVRRLREAMPPDGHLALLVPEKTADLWRHNPHVNQIITLDPRRSELAQARDLKKGRFDLAVIFPNSLHAAMIPFLARIPRRVAYRGNSRRMLLTESFDADPRFETRPRLSPSQIMAVSTKRLRSKNASQVEYRHQILHYLELVAKLGANSAPCAPNIFLTDAERAASEKFFSDDDRPTLAVAPSAEYGAAKRWLEESFVETIRAIRAKNDCRVIFVGSKTERPYCKRLAEKINAASHNPVVTVIAGRTSLRELCACLARCRVLLTNDTGPMHLAAAVGARTVAIFGSTEPTLTGPNYPGCEPRHIIIRHPVACSPCFLRECPIDFRCMNRINPEEVVAAVLKLM